MKFFYTRKEFQRVIGELEKKVEVKERTIITLHGTLDRKEEKISELKKIKSAYEKAIEKLAIEKTELEKKIIAEQNSKGGYVKENNKLKKEKEQFEIEIQDLKAKIKDLESDRYLIKKIPTGRTKNTIKTKIAPPMKSNVRRFMKENFDD